MQIKTKLPKTKPGVDPAHDERSWAGEYDFGDDLDGMVKLFGKEVVFSNARSNMTVGVQSLVRDKLKKGSSKTDIDAAVNGHKPGLRKPVKSRAERMREEISGLSAEDKKDLLNQLRGEK